LSFNPELVLSDVGRDGNPNAGFEDITTFRDDGLYRGPVVFYSGRISASKRNRAQSLGAPIVGEEPELMRAIGEHLSAAPTSPPIAA